MADKFAYHHGDTNVRRYAVDSATVIELGDLLFLDTDDVKPASSQATVSPLSTAQETFHDIFAGVALERSRNGDTDTILVASTGVFRLDIASTTVEVGDLMGVTVTAGAVVDQEVVSVATENLAVGKITKREASAVTAVLVEIEATVAFGGPQTPA